VFGKRAAAVREGALADGRNGGFAAGDRKY
jgi:hypothetical protein